MPKRPKKHSEKFFKMPKEVTRGGYYLEKMFIKTKLSEYLGTDAIVVLALIGNKQSGNSAKDQNLIFSSVFASHLMSRPTFYKCIFRLWAYRLLAVHDWGGKGRATPGRYQLIRKWRTLIRMPDRLEKIHELVVEYEKVKLLKSNPSHKKSQRLKIIKSKIKDIII